MSEFEYKDYTPANARVIVDYTKGQKVSFSYPIKWTYWKAVFKRAYPTIMAFWLSIHTFWVGYILPYLIIVFVVVLAYLVIIEYTIEIYSETLIYNLAYFAPALVAVFYVFIIPMLITLYLARDKELLAKWMPKLGYWTYKLCGRIKETTFSTKDVIDNRVSIPIFNNVYLNYKCEGDFNKLEKVEILEIPFNYRERGFWNPFKEKVYRNDYLYRVVFYFSETPKNGKMEVEFN